MVCADAKKLKRWVVYDAKEQTFTHLTSDEWKDMIEDRPIKFVDREIFDRITCKQVWVDGIINSSFFK